MQLPNVMAIRNDVPQYIRYQNAGDAAAPARPGAAQPSRPVQPDIIGPGRNAVAPSTPDGDVLDIDWGRVRRFVHRYQWQNEPPDTLRDFQNQREKSKPIATAFSRDGDRADFGSWRTLFNKNIIYGKDGATKPDPIEPKGDCGTCDSRRYVDKSDDSSVSYQTPTKISPQTSAMAVAAHEREHVFNERAKAGSEGREIVNQTVSIKYAICPECNIMYAAGGTTRTQSIKTDGGDQLDNTDAEAPQQMPESL